MEEANPLKPTCTNEGKSARRSYARLVALRSPHAEARGLTISPIVPTVKSTIMYLSRLGVSAQYATPTQRSGPWSSRRESDDGHSAVVHLGDERAPVVNRAKVRVEDRKVERRVPVRAPGLSAGAASV